MNIWRVPFWWPVGSTEGFLKPLGVSGGGGRESARQLRALMRPKIPGSWISLLQWSSFWEEVCGANKTFSYVSEPYSLDLLWAFSYIHDWLLLEDRCNPFPAALKLIALPPNEWSQELSLTGGAELAWGTKSGQSCPLAPPVHYDENCLLFPEHWGVVLSSSQYITSANRNMIICNRVLIASTNICVEIFGKKSITQVDFDVEIIEISLITRRTANWLYYHFHTRGTFHSSYSCWRR